MTVSGDRQATKGQMNECPRAEVEATRFASPGMDWGRGSRRSDLAGPGLPEPSTAVLVTALAAFGVRLRRR